VEAPKPTPKPEPKPEIKPEPKSESKPEPKPDPKLEQKRLEAEAKREAKAKANAAAEAERAEVLAAVNNWAKAWSARNVTGYLNAYASDFTIPAGQSRKEWANERRARIEDKKHINVKIESPQVSVSGNTATVKFRQIYDSDRFDADSRKVLVLVKQAGKWQIKQERSGS
jgi:ketosteroid isomerase-like protein